MRPFGSAVLLVFLSLFPLLRAQQPPDPPTAEPNPGGYAEGQSNVETDLAAEVQQLREEVDRLRGEVTLLQSELDEMRKQRTIVAAADEPTVASPEKNSSAPATPAAGPKSSRSAPSHAQAAPSPAAPAGAEADEKAATTVIVFRDGHRTEVKNYAIIGQALWVYTEDDSKKIPLSDVDLTATKKANSERGVTFQLPPGP